MSYWYIYICTFQLMNLKAFERIILDKIRKLLLFQLLLNQHYANLIYFNYMGQYLSEPKTEKHSKTTKKDNIIACTSSMQGWLKENIESSVHEIDIGDGNSVFAVFDGTDSRVISRYVGEIFVGVLKGTDQYQQKKYVEAMDVAFKKIDEILRTQQAGFIIREYKGLPIPQRPVGYDPNKMILEFEKTNLDISNREGCTGSAILITPDSYITANIGRNTSVLCKSGQVQILGRPQTLEDEGEVKRIEEAGGVVHMGTVNGASREARCFGYFDLKNKKQLPYTHQMLTCKPQLNLQPRSQPHDQFLLLGTDGIWQRYIEDPQQLVNIVKENLQKTGDVQKTCELLLDGLLGQDTMTGIGCDNMTVVLVSLK